MAIYQSMQRVRFSSADGYKKFQMLFADVRRHLKPLPGFLHLTWWVHPDDPTWFNEVSFWTSKEALEDWHMTIYHKPSAQTFPQAFTPPMMVLSEGQAIRAALSTDCSARTG